MTLTGSLFSVRQYYHDSGSGIGVWCCRQTRIDSMGTWVVSIVSSRRREEDLYGVCQELWKLPSQVDRSSVCGCLHLAVFPDLEDAVFEHATLQDQTHQVLSSIQRSPALVLLSVRA